ncbi:MAG: ubiquinol-cytochrome c reductase cytochrome b subunit [Actinomycetota bacterium]|nr:ubiquinol-cytochrome c reductase cytochrome b subunit [Actinomycetota bacterium]
MSTLGRAAGGAGVYLDERLGVARIAKKGLRKVFPDHWSFMLGEIALYTFIICLLTGTFLTFWFVPSTHPVEYEGAYVPLRGVEMSQAYDSSLRISFDIRGGLLMRQIHHWAALLFVASITVHLLRVFFTGAYRKPREINWLIGVGLLTLALVEGFAGYSLPDDLLSGTGLRIAEGIMRAVPVVGTYLSFFVFGGEFPGAAIIPRLYTVHVLLVPGILLALITVHLLLVFFHKHTQFPGPGRKETNVVGYPLMPVYIAKAGGFFFIVFGVCAALGAFASVNPIWRYGPYEPSQVTAGSQPDWYIGWLEGALRVMPYWETRLFGFTLSWNVLFPSLILPGIMMTLMAVYPFLEAWITGDRREHHLLDRPRNAPTRTALGVMSIFFYVVLWINGGNDILAVKFNLSLNAITWTCRLLLIFGTPLVYVITKRICLGLQRRDRDLVLHGRETGNLVRLPSGEVIDLHEPISPAERYLLTSHEQPRPVELTGDTDDNGVPRPHRGVERIRARLSNWFYSDRVEPPTPQEVRELEQAGSGHH